MSRVHVAPSATANGKLEVYGAPPLSVVPSEQLRLQPTSPGYDPPEQVIAEEIVGDGGENGGDVGGMGEGGAQSILGYEVSCVLPIGTVPRRISQWPPPPVRTPPHASPAAMQAVLAAVMLP